MSAPAKILTEEEKAARALRAKRRFKAVVRLVIANNAWLSENQEEEQVSDNVAKNVHMLTRKKRGVTGSQLTVLEKCILRKPVIARTDEEKHILSLKLSTLKAFRKFSQEVKLELPTIMYFVYYGAGREILRQGSDPINMYVIISGEVLVSRKHWDNVMNCEVWKDLATLGEGSIFGEVSLMEENMTRTATVTTLTPCELLYLSDDDFLRVLKSTVQALWDEIQENMSLFRYFDRLTVVDIREGCMIGKKKIFHEDEIILMDNPEHSLENVYFIIRGLVHLFEYMLIGTGMKKGKRFYKLLDENHSKINPAKDAKSREIKMFMKEVDDAEKLNQRVSSTVRILPEGMTAKWHFFKLCSHKKLGCFNVGESLHNRLIVACSEVECFILPREYLDEKCDVTFRNIHLYFNKIIPTPKEIFESYIGHKAWTRYKDAMIDNILKEKKISVVNTISNVPYSIRLADDVDFWLRE